jgi:tetratricopeptide (TPR) repeat protein
MPSRREKIEAMLHDDPADPFLHYTLALELDKEGEHERSLGEYRGLMTATEPYVPAFFMAAQQLARLGRVDEARTALESGIQQARTSGDLHAAGEMSEFLASLALLGE